MSCDFQVIGGNRVKDPKKKSMRKKSGSVSREMKAADGSLDKPLHWVNLQILDHRCEGVRVCGCVHACTFMSTCVCMYSQVCMCPQVYATAVACMCVHPHACTHIMHHAHT